MSRVPTEDTAAAAAPVRRGATVQRYGPLANPRPAKDEETRRGQAPAAAAAAPSRARRGSVPPGADRGTRAAASSAASTAAASSEDAAIDAADSGRADGPFAAFPALDRFLAEKGHNLRARRQQQLQIEAAEAAAIERHQQLTAGQRPDAAYPPFRSAVAYAGTPALAYPYQHPLPHPAYAAQPALVHPPPQPLTVSIPPRLPPPAAASASLPAPPSDVSMDPEPLSPASLQEVLLIPEVQAHLRELKRQWRKEVEHELRFQQPPRASRTTKANSNTYDSDNEAEGEHKSGGGPRVRFSDANTATDSPAVDEHEAHAVEVQRLQDQLLAEQQAHSATMSRLTQLTAARLEEQKAQEAELQQSAKLVEQLQESVRAAEAKAAAAETSLTEERQRHQLHVSTLQRGGDSLVSSLTAKYEALLDKYTSEKLEAAEALSTQRLEHARVQGELQSLQSNLEAAQHQLARCEERVATSEQRATQAESAQRLQEAQWAEKEREWTRTQQQRQREHEAVAADKARLQQLVDELQQQVRSLHEQLRSQTEHADERLRAEESQKHEQLRFTQQVHDNIELLSAESQAKQAELVRLQGELRQVLQGAEEARATHAARVYALQQDLEASRSEVSDCKMLIKTLMHEEKQTRAQRNEAKQRMQRMEQQVQQMEQQLQTLKASNARLQDENVQLHSRTDPHASRDRLHSLEHELRISHEIQSRLEKEKEALAMRVEEMEENMRGSARRQAEERTQHEQAIAEAAAAAAAAATASSAPAEPDPHLLRSFHELSDKLAIKEKILESLTEQLASESRTAASLGGEVRALKKAQADLERSVSEMDEARRAAQRELRELQVEAQEWGRWEAESEDMRREIEAAHAENEKLQKQLSKKHDSLSYIEGELLGMKGMFERKERDAQAAFDKQMDDMKEQLTHAKEEVRTLHAQLHERTQQYQDAQNSAHQSEQELRMLILEFDKEKRQRQQMRLQLQAMLPQL